MNAPVEELLIKKCRTDPYLTYPQFDRYLTGGQLKVVNCLLRCGASSGRAFPSNERIAWEAGLKRDSVRAIKSELGKLGVLTKREIKRGINTIWVYTVDTTWKREQYRSEFELHYNSRATPEADGIKYEIERLKQVLASSSSDNEIEVLDRLKVLLKKQKLQDGTPIEESMAENLADSETQAPEEEEAQLPAQETGEPTRITETSARAPDRTLFDNKPTTQDSQTSIDEAFLNYIVDQTPNVHNRHAYKAKVRRLLCEGELDGIEEYRQGYEQSKKIKKIAKHLEHTFAEIYGEKHSFDGEVCFDDGSKSYFAFFGGYKVAVSEKTANAAINDQNAPP
jgi:hypothetical protein